MHPGRVFPSKGWYHHVGLRYQCTHLQRLNFVLALNTMFKKPTACPPPARNIDIMDMLSDEDVGYADRLENVSKWSAGKQRSVTACSTVVTVRQFRKSAGTWS